MGLFLAGVLQALMTGSQMYAIMETDVTYVIAFKRAGMIISVLGGGLLLGEKNLKIRLGPPASVFIGLLLIMF